jgi:hypothetical protein
MAHELEIGHIHNQGHLLSDGLDTAIISSQLNQLSIDVLPQAIVNALDTLLTDTRFNDKVYRINKLHLSFSMMKQDLHTQTAGQIFANQLIQALSNALLNDIGNSDNIKCYANNVEYMGFLISDLLKGTAWRQWQYAEFSSLQHIESDEAAIQLLVARSTCLVSLVRTIEQQQALTLLQTAITPGRAQMLFEQWAGVRIDEVFNKHFLTHTDHWVHVLNEQSVKQNLFSQSLISDVVKTFILSMTKRTQQPTQISTVLISIAQLLFILKHKETISQWLKNEAKNTTQTSAEFKQFSPKEYALARHLLAFIRQSKNHAQHIARMIALSADTHKQGNTESTERHETQVHSTRHIDCAHAGVVLLVPVIISIGLLDYYSTTLIRNALFNIAHADDNNPEYSWLYWLFPDDDTPCASYPDHLPASTQLGLDKEQRAELMTLNDQPDKQLSRLITMQFAIRLSGLQLSSIAYLNQQFLHIAGAVQQDNNGVQVSLSPIALNIVLSMSGFSPWQQKLPWLKKTLSIEVRS